MGSIVVAVAGDMIDSLYAGLKEFPAERVMLIVSDGNEGIAEGARKDLAKFRIPVEFVKSKTDSFEEMFRTISHVKEAKQGARIILNTECDYKSSCIMLSAAFVNGLQAIGIMGETVIAYPIMKFSYYNALSDKKIKLLETIEKNNGFESLEALSKASKISLPLATYHIRGSRKKVGLEELGLVSTYRSKGRLGMKLTPLGKLLIGGYLKYEKAR